MKAFLVILFGAMLLSNSLRAQDPDTYFHAGAQAYINEDIQAAKINVENGLAMAPNDEKLVALKALLDKQEEQKKQQQQKQDENKDQEKEEKKDEQSQESEGQQQEKQDQQKQDQQNQEQNQQNGEQQDQQEGQMKEMKMSKEQVEQMLQMLRQEEDKLQEKLQNVKARGQKKKLDKDW